MKDCILIYFICEVEKFLTYEVDQWKYWPYEVDELFKDAV